MRRIFSGALAGVFLLSLLTGCSSGDPGYQDMNESERRTWVRDQPEYEPAQYPGDVTPLISTAEATTGHCEDEGDAELAWDDFVYGQAPDTDPDIQKRWYNQLALSLRVSVAENCPEQYAELDDWLESSGPAR